MAEPEHVAERTAQFKRRLEAFSDIVFGLSLSELALQLGLPATASGLIDDPQRYVIFFASFAIICSLWLAHHRMFRIFSPTKVSVFLNFVYLAFTVLMPFGMQALLKFPESPIGLGIYAVCYAVTAASMSALLVLGMRENAWRFDEEEQLDLFKRVVRYAVLCTFMLVALVLLPWGGLQVAGPILILIVPTMFIARRMIRHVPHSLLTKPAVTPASSESTLRG